MLPEEWLVRVAPLLALGDAQTGGIRFKPSQVASWMRVRGATRRRLGRRIRARTRGVTAFRGVHPEEAPRIFHGELREYQREALGWMRFLREFGFGGCLADDMGLGKTVMVLAMLAGRRTHPAGAHGPPWSSFRVRSCLIG